MMESSELNDVAWGASASTSMPSTRYQVHIPGIRGVKEGQLSMRFGEKDTYGLQKQEKHMRLGCIPITLFRDAQRLS